MIKARRIEDLEEGTTWDDNGHEDSVVDAMLDGDRPIMHLEPYRDIDGNVVPNWFRDVNPEGYCWHISWLEIIDDQKA